MSGPDLEAIYARIPKVNGCHPGCNNCCGPVPVGPAEARRIASPIRLEDYRGVKITPTNCGTCAFSTSAGCSIYNQRPLLCRLFGAVDHPRMTCPHGARAKNLLTNEQARELINLVHGAPA